MMVVFDGDGEIGSVEIEGKYRCLCLLGQILKICESARRSRQRIGTLWAEGCNRHHILRFGSIQRRQLLEVDVYICLRAIMAQ
jgi:hypothetical protein